MEKTFFIIKPDGVRRQIVGDILQRIERRGFTIEKLEMRLASKELLEKHYCDLIGRSFFPQLVDYMTNGPLIIGVMSGNEVISSWRMMMGVTNPNEALPGTIRGDFAQGPDEGGATFNVVHGSDSLESASKEISLWFGDK